MGKGNVISKTFESVVQICLSNSNSGGYYMQYGSFPGAIREPWVSHHIISLEVFTEMELVPLRRRKEIHLLSPIYFGNLVQTSA